MADIYCHCGEPWDLDELHEHIAEHNDRSVWLTSGRYDDTKYQVLFSRARRDFRERGCEMFGSKHSDANPQRGATFQALDEILGDDVDGAISMMEDAEQMGLF